MPAKHNAPRITDTRIAQRAIIHQVIRDDHRERWSPKQIEQALSDVTPETINDAIIRLEANGAIYCLDEYIGAARCTRYLYLLDLIGI
jgi:hypothetical protein